TLKKANPAKETASPENTPKKASLTPAKKPGLKRATLRKAKPTPKEGPEEATDDAEMPKND
ncbi:MAG: hypothetical protein AAFY70_18055, partial [Bacteroidota bacterium]